MGSPSINANDTATIEDAGIAILSDVESAAKPFAVLSNTACSGNPVVVADGDCVEVVEELEVCEDEKLRDAVIDGEGVNTCEEDIVTVPETDCEGDMNWLGVLVRLGDFVSDGL